MGFSYDWADHINLLNYKENIKNKKYICPYNHFIYI